MASVTVCSAVSNPNVTCGGGKIVVDGLGHTDDFQSLLEKLVADLLRSIAADGDDGVDAELGRVGDHLAGNVARNFLAVLDVLVVEGIAAVGGAEDRSAARQNAGDFLEREFEGFFRPDQAVEAIGDADDLPSVLEMAALVAARMTALRPGASPPPVAIPMQRMSAIEKVVVLSLRPFAR